MFTTFVVAVVLVGLLFAAMALGVLLGRPPIKGSCGGVGADGACPVCGGQPALCDAANDEGTRGTPTPPARQRP
jgi:hypothetical protein